MENQEIAKALDELLDEIAKDTEERHDEEIRRFVTPRNLTENPSVLPQFMVCLRIDAHRVSLYTEPVLKFREK